jgi:nucleoid-associated protein YgaU
MTTRYLNQKVFRNAKAAWKRYLKKTRGMPHVDQYSTAKFKFPSDGEIQNFSTIRHIWGTGDRYYKLANQYYGDPELWWIIAFYNQKPTEFHLSLGDVVFIPTPLETVLYHIGY